MKGLLFRVFALAAAVGGFALLTPACADNNQTIFIRQVQAMTTSDKCIVQPDTGVLFRSHGFLDVAMRGSYDAWLLVGNQLVRRGLEDRLRTETNRVQLYEAEVTVYDFAGNPVTCCVGDSCTEGSYTEPISGFVDPAISSNAGWGLAGVTLIDPMIAGCLYGLDAQTVVSRVKIYGVTLGELEVETDYWDFPITVCTDCLGCVPYQSEDDDWVCPCLPGQDESHDCRMEVRDDKKNFEGFLACQVK
ncbi:MAG: hypothetical protein HY744_33985 [Deltaproteobacteria bacterium]|nr:hypothetical protein [Deltaproteobacteria bacterium]